MKNYDFIIAGAGGAGLGLAYALSTSPLAGSSILLVDRDAKKQNDRTWCYWTHRNYFFNSLASCTWEQLDFIGEGFQQPLPLRDYRYYLIRGIDFYHFTLNELLQRPQVTFLQAGIDNIEDGEETARVTAGGETFSGRWVFNSIVRPGELNIDPRRYHVLKQHFRGWEVETGDDFFDPRRPIFFDFRTPQKGSMRFFYVLPYSARRALVEYTIFSADLLPDAEYDRELKTYLADVLKLNEYSVASVENGIIPMTDYPFPRRGGKRILNIGTRGGLVKPSTGFAFLRMQQDAAAVTRSLVQNGHPFAGRSAPQRYAFYDSLMLELMAQRGGEMKKIFTQLFKNNSIQRIFRFLDEEARFSEDVRLMVSLPLPPFLWALGRKILSRR